jgi:hypothetical protein
MPRNGSVPRTIQLHHLSDSYTLLPEAQATTAELLEHVDDLNHIRMAQVRIVCVLSQPQLFLHGKPANAVITDGRVQAIQPVKGLYEFLRAAFVGELLEGVDPDYLVFFDAARWSVLDPERRERLVYHELCHLEQKQTRDGEPAVDDEGRPKLALTTHDYETFDREIRRYGPVLCDLDPIVEALAAGIEGARNREKAKRRGGLRRAG